MELINKKIIKIINEIFILKNKAHSLHQKIKQLHISTNILENLNLNVSESVSSFVSTLIEPIKSSYILDTLDYPRQLISLYEYQYKSKVLLVTLKDIPNFKNKVVSYTTQFDYINNIIAEKTALIELYYVKYIK